MINIFRAHSYFKQNYNKLDSNHKKDFQPALIDDYLFLALQMFQSFYFSGNFNKASRYGFESVQSVRDFLAPYVEETKITNIPVPENNYGFYVYKLNLEELDPKYNFLIPGTITFDSATCGWYEAELESNSDSISILRDSYRKPNSLWKKAIALEKSIDGEVYLYIYTDKIIDISEIYFSYMRKPKRPFIGGYDTIEYLSGDTSYPNSGSPIEHLDFPDRYENIIIQLTTDIVSGAIGDYDASKFNFNKLVTTT